SHRPLLHASEYRRVVGLADDLSTDMTPSSLPRSGASNEPRAIQSTTTDNNARPTSSGTTRPQQPANTRTGCDRTSYDSRLPRRVRWRLSSSEWRSSASGGGRDGLDC